MNTKKSITTDSIPKERPNTTFNNVILAAALFLVGNNGWALYSGIKEAGGLGAIQQDMQLFPWFDLIYFSFGCIAIVVFLRIYLGVRQQIAAWEKANNGQ
jgi:hypothetical protein